MLAPAPLATIPPTLLSGRRVAVLGSGGGLGRAVAAAAQAAGAEVTGIDPRASFAHLDTLIRADLTDPAAIDAAAAALPDGLDALALFPDLPGTDPAAVLAHGVIAPLRLAQALAPRLAPGAAIVLRGALEMGRDGHLPAIRAARALRTGDLPAFVSRWGLDAEPARAPLLAGWALQAWALARAAAWPGLRINTVIPAAPDGRLPPAQAAALGLAEGDGTTLAARAALYLMSPLSQGLTGAGIAADGGLSARLQTGHEGL
jgi:NAD(P)-dependent dehydrogenase (short-subunit alcohol dehydrogenase family)